MALNLKDFRFLIVDDLRDMRITLRGMLDSLKATQFWEAKNCEEALEVLRVQPIDIVLCDYNLGDTRDGQQLFEEARGRGTLVPHAAWIMITAESSMGMVMGVIENNPDGYLVKPINKAALQGRLERAVARKMIVKDVELAIRNSKFSDAIALADMQIQRYPNVKSELLRLKTEAMLRNGAYAEVIDLCAGLLEERQHEGAEVDIPWMLIHLGRARYELGDVRQARLTFQKVIDQNPTVMEAYDWLARIERDQGNNKDAQRIISNALGVSARSIRRQQSLADVAIENQDFATAERAFDKAVRLGDDSVFARPDDQVGLVSAVRVTKGDDAALKTMSELVKRAVRKRGGKGPHWRVSAMEGSLLASAGRQVEATASVERALEAFRVDTSAIPHAATLELARACFDTGNAEHARGIIDKLVRENHDRPEVTGAVNQLFTDLGMAEEGAALVEGAQQQLIKVNNEGVLLAKAGRYAEAVACLQKAAEDLPNNLTVTLNVLQALLMQMQAEGVTNVARYQAREHLGRAQKLAPKSEKVALLRNRLEGLLASSTKPVAG